MTKLRLPAVGQVLRHVALARFAHHMETLHRAGVNFVLHTAGWLEGGLVMGYETGEREFVLLEEEELAAVRLESTRTIDIERMTRPI